MLALACSAWARRLCRCYPEASLLVDEVVALADEKGAAYWKATGKLEQGELFALTGQASVAVRTITAGLTALRSTGATVFIPSFLSSLARAYADLGRFDEAWRCVDEAMTAVGTMREAMLEAEIHRTAGEITLIVNWRPTLTPGHIVVSL